jgi:hypothetical protein
LSSHSVATESRTERGSRPGSMSVPVLEPWLAPVFTFTPVLQLWRRQWDTWRGIRVSAGRAGFVAVGHAFGGCSGGGPRTRNLAFENCHGVRDRGSNRTKYCCLTQQRVKASLRKVIHFRAKGTTGRGGRQVQKRRCKCGLRVRRGEEGAGGSGVEEERS